MVRTTAEKAIIDIFQFFRYQKNPTDIQIDAWYKKISFIPEEAVDWIVNSITDLDRLPTNLPKEIIKQWYSYRKAHPEKTVPEQTMFCEDCLGHGTHMFKKLDHRYPEPMYVSYVVMCEACNNWEKHFGTVARNGGQVYIEGKQVGQYISPVARMIRRDIEERGWIYLSQIDKRKRAVVHQQPPEIKFKEIPNIPTQYEGPMINPDDYNTENIFD